MCDSEIAFWRSSPVEQSLILVMISYIKLKISRPLMPRPYVSPLGIPGAVIGLLLATTALLACFAVKSNRPSVWSTLGFLVVAIVYFLVYNRHRLVAQAPEEEVAIIAQAEQELAHQ